MPFLEQVGKSLFDKELALDDLQRYLAHVRSIM